MTDKTLALLSLGVSGVAVILTQFRPLYTQLDRPALEFRVLPQLRMRHDLGDLVAVLNIDVQNKGRAPGEFERLALVVAGKDNSFRRVLPAVGLVEPGYRVEGTESSWSLLDARMPMHRFRVEPDRDAWLTVEFRREPERDQEARTVELVTTVREAELQHRLSPFPYRPFVLDDSVFTETRMLALERLKEFAVGEYNLLVAGFDSSNDTALFSDLFQFTVFDANRRMFDLTIERYKYGEGITRGVTTDPMIIRLRRVSDSSLQDELLRRMASGD